MIHRLIGAVPLLAAVSFMVSSARAQDPPKAIPGEGTHYLRAILNEMKMEAILTEAEFALDVRNQDCSHILLIVLGDTGILNRIPVGLETFLHHGGAALVASDRRGGPWRGLSRGTKLDGLFVEATQAASKYRDSSDCPFVQPKPSETVPVFNGLTRVATNRPSFLHIDSTTLNTLAVFPADCRIANTFANTLVGRPLCFAVGGTVGAGKILLMADHSVFINDMIRQPDNNNFDLACSALRWLTEDGQQRNRVLFVEEGKVETNFRFSLKEPPLPGLPTESDLIRLANQTLLGLEHEDFFNRMVLDRVPQPLVLAGLVVVLSLFVLVFGAVCAIRARHQTTPAADAALAGPSMTPVLVATGAVFGFVMALLVDSLLATRTPFSVMSALGLGLGALGGAIAGRVAAGTGPVVDGNAAEASATAQRQNALVQADNFWEPARALARQFLEAAAGLRPDSWLAARPREPHITVADPARRRTCQKEFRKLWRLAASVRPFRVSTEEFNAFVNRLATLQAQMAEGSVRLAGDG